MTDQQLEQRLMLALEHAAPDDLDDVLSRCAATPGAVVKQLPRKRHIPTVWLRGLVAACLALALVGGGSALFRQFYTVAAVISLDVNPSIELRVNLQEKVLSCVPLNRDAAAVLFDIGGGMSLKGSDLDAAVNAVVDALVQSGYLTDGSAAILISVEDNDQTRAVRLQQELTSSVDGALQTQAIQATVLSQKVTGDTDLKAEAQANHISTGKAALINQVLAANDSLTFDELASLPVEALQKMAEESAPAQKAEDPATSRSPAADTDDADAAPSGQLTGSAGGIETDAPPPDASLPEDAEPSDAPQDAEPGPDPEEIEPDGEPETEAPSDEPQDAEPGSDPKEDEPETEAPSDEPQDAEPGSDPKEDEPETEAPSDEPQDAEPGSDSEEDEANDEPEDDVTQDVPADGGSQLPQDSDGQTDQDGEGPGCDDSSGPDDDQDQAASQE